MIDVSPEVINTIQAGATPLIGVVLYLVMKVNKALHGIDRRLVRVETKLETQEILKQ